MKKITEIIKKPRSAGLLALGWLHCGLLLGIVFAAFFDMLALLADLELMSPQAAFLRGLLLAVPTGLCWLAIKRLRTLWQFFLCAIGLCGLSWLLSGHPGGAAFMALMCIIRVRSRLAEEEEGPVQSLFDTPSYFGLCVFAVAFLASAGIGKGSGAGGGLPRLQRLSIIGAVLYLLVCMSYNGLKRLDNYLTLNQGMHGLPARRIQRIAGSALVAAVLLAAVLLVPMSLGNTGFVRITLPEHSHGSAAVEFKTEENNGGGPAMIDMSGLMEGRDQWQIPPIVGQIVFALVGAALAVGLVMAVIQLFKDFRRSFSDSRDVVQYLGRKDTDQVEAEALAGTLRRPRAWDRSPNAVVRRKYRRTLLRSGVPPEPWMTPKEAELSTGVDAPALHRLYEKARYGREGCTQEDLKELR